METNIVNFVPNSLIDDYFFWGFIGGLVSYAWYLLNSRKDPKNHLSKIAGIYGVILSGCMGGLLAIAADHTITLSIIVGLTNQFVYLAIIRSVKNNGFINAVKEVLLTYLTKGVK